MAPAVQVGWQRSGSLPRCLPRASACSSPKPAGEPSPGAGPAALHRFPGHPSGFEMLCPHSAIPHPRGQHPVA